MLHIDIFCLPKRSVYPTWAPGHLWRLSLLIDGGNIVSIENQPEAMPDQGIAKNEQKATRDLDWRITRPLGMQPLPLSWVVLA